MPNKNKETKDEQVEKAANTIKKINKFFSSQKMTWIITILCGLVVATLLYMFISNGTNRSSSLTVSEKQYYTTDKDEQVLVNIQDLTNTRLSFLSEIDKLISRDDLDKDEKISFIKDIKGIMIDNTKVFNDEVNSLGEISEDPKDDIDNMNDISSLSLKYADTAIEYYENGKDEKDLARLFQTNSQIRKNLSNMKYTEYGKKNNKFHTNEEIKEKGNISK
ncbi:hypothetical protein CPT_Machias_219 [Staphylococcus phage Machias]|nr:hypothetical protein CPT_Machias_219 [Staphylococcus phage Machias]